MSRRIPKIGFGLFVNRLHWTVSSTCMRKYFSKFGNVLFTEVQINTKTGLHRGFGWVRMSSEAEISQVLSQSRHQIEGYEINVNRDRRDIPQPDISASFPEMDQERTPPIPPSPSMEIPEPVAMDTPSSQSTHTPN